MSKPKVRAMTRTLRMTNLLALLLAFLSSSTIEAQPSNETAAHTPCAFCLSGDSIALPDKPIDIPGFEFLGTCGIVEALILPTLPDDECLQLTALLRSYCGCPQIENACTLCTDGSPIPDDILSEEVGFLAPAFGGVAPTCEFLDGFLRTNFIFGEEGCGAFQIVNAACGCPPLVDHCVYCPNEEGVLHEEYADKVLPFASNEALGITGTCEIYWHTQFQYKKDDIECQQSVFLTFHCGCNDGLMGYMGTTSTRQEIVMACIPRVVGLMSLIASILVQVHILRDRKKRWSVYHQLVFLITTFDMVTALVYIVGAAAAKEMNDQTGLTNGVYGAHGNDATCKTSGFFFHLGFTSVYLNVSLMVYFVLVIVYGVREAKLRSLRRYLFVLPLLLGFALSFASISYMKSAWNHCQADTDPWGNTRWSLLLFHVMPIVGSTTVILGLLVFLYAKVRIQLRKTQDKKLRNFSIDGSGDQSSSLGFSVTNSALTKTTAALKKRRRRSSMIAKQKKDSLERDVFWVCVSYATAFAVSWPILLFGQFQGANFTLPFWFWVIVVTVAPAQGLSNAYCYFRPHLSKQKKKDDAAKTPFCQRFSQEMLYLCCVCGRESDVSEFDPADELAHMRQLRSSLPVSRTGVSGHAISDDENGGYASSDDEVVLEEAIILEKFASSDDEFVLEKAVILEKDAISDDVFALENAAVPESN